MGEPPLDCVGTVEELVLSLQLTASQDKFSTSYLMKLAQNKGIIASRDWQEKLQAMQQLQDEQVFPNELADKLLQTLRSELDI